MLPNDIILYLEFREYFYFPCIVFFLCQLRYFLSTNATDHFMYIKQYMMGIQGCEVGKQNGCPYQADILKGRASIKQIITFFSVNLCPSYSDGTNTYLSTLF